MYKNFFYIFCIKLKFFAEYETVIMFAKNYLKYEKDVLKVLWISRYYKYVLIV